MNCTKLLRKCLKLFLTVFPLENTLFRFHSDAKQWAIFVPCFLRALYFWTYALQQNASPFRSEVLPYAPYSAIARLSSIGSSGQNAYMCFSKPIAVRQKKVKFKVRYLECAEFNFLSKWKIIRKKKVKIKSEIQGRISGIWKQSKKRKWKVNKKKESQNKVKFKVRYLECEKQCKKRKWINYKKTSQECETALTSQY